ncbi:MAG: transposase [Thermococcus sp.]|nr:transposase [Thermococcus sp.]
MEYFPLLLGVVMGAITSYTDIKTGFIDDIHVFPTLVLIGKLLGWENEEPEGILDRIPVPVVEGGIVYYLYRGLSSGDSMLALSGLLGFLVGLGLGWILYYLGGWASGDAVILAGFSALLPYAPASAKVVPPYGVDYPLYPLTIFLNSLMAVFPFIFMYALGVIVYRREFGELKDILVSRVGITIQLGIWLMAAYGIRLVLANLTGWMLVGVGSWIFVMVLLYVFGRYRKAGTIIGVAVIGFMIYLNPEGTLLSLLRLVAILYLFRLFYAVVSYIRKRVLMEEVPVEALREWDILGETIYEYNMWPMRDRRSFWDRIKEAVGNKDVSALRNPQGRIIASPTAEGLTKEQIEELRRYVEMGMLENRFLRKKSMPFAPALFIGFLISYFWGDLFWWIQLKMAGL